MLYNMLCNVMYWIAGSQVSRMYTWSPNSGSRKTASPLCGGPNTCGRSADALAQTCTWRQWSGSISLRAPTSASRRTSIDMWRVSNTCRCTSDLSAESLSGCTTAAGVVVPSPAPLTLSRLTYVSVSLSQQRSRPLQNTEPASRGSAKYVSAGNRCENSCATFCAKSSGILS